MPAKPYLAVLFLALTATAQAQDCTASGTVVNALTNQPIPQVQVAAESPDSRGASTDSDGNFLIPALPCGQLRLTATAPRFLPAELSPNSKTLASR